VALVGMAALACGVARASSGLSWVAAGRLDVMSRPSLQSLPQVVCPSRRRCVMIDGAGNVAVIDMPWPRRVHRRVTHVSRYPLEALACPAAQLCVVLDQWGEVIVGTAGPNGSMVWANRGFEGVVAFAIGGGGQFGVDCASVHLCVAWLPGGGGNVLVSTDPAHGAWTVDHVDHSGVPCGPNGESSCPGALNDVSCPSDELCVGVDDNGWMVESSAPAAGASSWQAMPLDAPPKEGSAQSLDVIACPSARLCVAGDGVGRLMVSTAPARGPASWSLIETKPGYYKDPTGLTCPSTTLCVLTKGARVAVATRPARAGGWRVVNLGASTGAFGLHTTCFSAHRCVTIDGNARAFSTTRPALPRAWSSTRLTTAHYVTTVACASATVCVAVDSYSNMFVATARAGTLRSAGHTPQG
jgi:hypothetical protein